MNYAAGDTVLLPPLRPQYAQLPTMYTFGSSPRHSIRDTQELYVPKTFTTRKGALLLFSEDYAMKHRQTHEEVTTKQPPEAVDLRTVEDLTKSILKYGSRSKQVRERRVWINLFLRGAF
jgi:hypothetical protein